MASISHAHGVWMCRNAPRLHTRCCAHTSSTSLATAGASYAVNTDQRMHRRYMLDPSWLGNTGLSALQRRGFHTSIKNSIGYLSDVYPLHVPYDAGTYFLHKKLGYRGIIVKSWKPTTVEYYVPSEPNVFDKDRRDPDSVKRKIDALTLESKTPPLLLLNGNLMSALREGFQETGSKFPQGQYKLTNDLATINLERVPVRTHNDEPYYQVLCHEEEFDMGKQDPFVLNSNSRQHLGQSNICHYSQDGYPQRGRRFLAPIIPGIDYVKHTDIIPFTPISSDCVQHPWFNMFGIVPSPETGGGEFTVFLRKKQFYYQFCDANKVGVESGNAYISYCERTNIQITLLPMEGSIGNPSKGTEISENNIWVYKVMVHNFGEEELTLMQRTWFFVCSDGSVQDAITGHGVIGFTPKLSKKYPSFSYSSSVSLLHSSSGFMGGQFSFKREDGSVVEVAAPTAELKNYKAKESQDEATKE